MISKPIFLLCTVLWPLHLWSATDNIVDGFNIGESNEIMGDIITNGTISLNEDFNTALDKVRNFNPEYAAQIEQIATTDETKTAALRMLRNWLAHQVFEKYEKLFMADLESRSAATGRAIKSNKYPAIETTPNGNETHYDEEIHWLDRGELDSKRCRTDGMISCQYPDGFEDFMVSTQSGTVNSGIFSEHYKKLYLGKDVPNKNYTLDCYLMLDNQPYNSEQLNISSNSLQEELLSLELFCTTEKYDEHHAYRTQMAQDAKNGRFKCKRYKQKPDGSRECVYKYDFLDERWTTDIIPAAHVQAYDMNYNHQVSNNIRMSDDFIDKDTLANLWNMEFNIVESKMKEIAPDVVVSAADKPETQRAQIYHNYLAQQAAQQTLIAVIQEMHTASRDTGRAIKTYDSNGNIVTANQIAPNTSGTYWLDRGALDTPKCRIGDGYYNPKCPYPSDFREKMITLQVYPSGDIYINMEEDTEQDGKLQHVATQMNYTPNHAQNILDTYKIMYDYSDFYRMQSEFNELAIRDNQILKLSKRQLNKIKRQCDKLYQEDKTATSELCKMPRDIALSLATVEGAAYTIVGN